MVGLGTHMHNVSTLHLVLLEMTRAQLVLPFKKSCNQVSGIVHGTIPTVQSKKVVLVNTRETHMATLVMKE